MSALAGCAHHVAPAQNGPMTPQASATLSHNDQLDHSQAAPGSADDVQSTANIVAQKVRDFTKSVATSAAADASSPGGPAVDPNSPAGRCNADALRFSPGPANDSESQASAASAAIAANKPAQLSPAPAARPAAPADSQNPIQAADLARANVVPDLSDADQPPSLDPFTAKLEKRIHDDPQDVSAQLDWQLYEFVHDEPVPQLPALAPLNAEDRELLSAVLDALSNFNNAVRPTPTCCCRVRSVRSWNWQTACATRPSWLSPPSSFAPG